MPVKSQGKLLLCKVGLDAHDLGPRLLAQGLRDAGLEVVYLGLRCTPEEVIKAALQEDTPVIGISSYCGGHIPIAERIIALLKEQGLERDRFVIFGGRIPSQDVKKLKKIGIDEVFTPEHNITDVANYVKNRIQRSQTQSKTSAN